MDETREARDSTLLRLASCLGKEKMVEFLLTNGARYSLTDIDTGRTLFNLTFKLEVVKALIR